MQVPGSDNAGPGSDILGLELMLEGIETLLKEKKENGIMFGSNFILSEIFISEWTLSLSIVKIFKLDPSVSKICCQKYLLNFDKVCINLTSPALTCPDFTNLHLTLYPDLSFTVLIWPVCLSGPTLF